MDRWDIVLLVVGGVVAVGTLVRLMRARRDQLIGQVKQQIDEHRRQQAAKAAAAEEDAA